MADTAKRVDVRLGAFACAIEGYDDPAEQLDRILTIIQKAVEASPGFAEIAMNLDPDSVETLRGSLEAETELEDGTGLLVVRNPEAPAIRGEDRAPAGAADGGEEIDEPDRSSGDVAERDTGQADEPDAPATVRDTASADPVSIGLAAAAAGGAAALMADDAEDAAPAATAPEAETSPDWLTATDTDETGAEDASPEWPAAPEAPDFAETATDDVLANEADAPDDHGTDPGVDDDGEGDTGVDSDADIADALRARLSPAGWTTDEEPPTTDSTWRDEPVRRVDDAPDLEGGAAPTDDDPAPNIFARRFSEPEPVDDAPASDAAEADETPISSDDTDAPVPNIFAAPPPMRETGLPRAELSERRVLKVGRERTAPNIFAAPSETPEAAAEQEPPAADAPGPNIFATPDTSDPKPDSAAVPDPEEIAEPVRRSLFSRARAAITGKEMQDGPDATAVSAAASAAVTGAASTGVSGFAERLARGMQTDVVGAPGTASAGGEPPAATPSGGMADVAALVAAAGAETVPDLLAASAAWLTMAEDTPRFTRRQVMSVFERIPGDHARTLEARIRGYGELVRNRTVVLVDDGYFALSHPARERFSAYFDQD